MRSEIKEQIMAEITVKDNNFDSEVLASDIPVLVDFWAEWCGPCRMLAPVVSAIAEKYEGKIKVCKVDVDEAMEVAEKYMISSIPAVKFFKGGEVVRESVGFVPQANLEKIIEEII